MQSDLRYTAGRPFESGLHELVASNACRRQFVGFELGDRHLIRGSDWTVVGHFDQGRAQNCVVHADAETVMSELSRTTYSSATLMLQSSTDYATLRRLSPVIQRCGSTSSTKRMQSKLASSR